MKPFEITKTKDFPPRTGEASLTVKIERTAFHVEEDIKIHVICNNFSPKTIYSLKFYLKVIEDKYHYSLSHDKMKSERTVKKLNAHVFTDNVFPLKAGLKWRGDYFYKLEAIGGLLPSKQDLGVFTREYELCVSATFKKASNLKVSVPILLKEKHK